MASTWWFAIFLFFWLIRSTGNRDLELHNLEEISVAVSDIIIFPFIVVFLAFVLSPYSQLIKIIMFLIGCGTLRLAPRSCGASGSTFSPSMPTTPKPSLSRCWASV